MRRGASCTSNYLVTPKRGLLQVQANQGSGQWFAVDCALADDQAALHHTLQGGSFAKLEGAVSRIDEGGMLLEQCRQVQ